jgi:hypothetical protein
MYKLKYFTKAGGMCASDLKNARQIEHINLQQISSFTDIKEFHLPFSGTLVGEYATVSMQNGDRFYIDNEEHVRISEALNCA